MGEEGGNSQMEMEMEERGERKERVGAVTLPDSHHVVLEQSVREGEGEKRIPVKTKTSFKKKYVPVKINVRKKSIFTQIFPLREPQNTSTV